MNLDPPALDAGVALTAFLAWTGLVGWVWQTRGIAVSARDDLADLKAERERDKVIWGARLSEVEKVSASMNRLADAVESGAKMTALQMANLAEKMTAHADYTKEQLAEIKGQIGDARLHAATNEAARRRTARSAKDRDG